MKFRGIKWKYPSGAPQNTPVSSLSLSSGLCVSQPTAGNTQLAWFGVKRVQRSWAIWALISFLHSLLNSIQRSDSQWAVNQPASVHSPALKSPALILRINKPCAEPCSRPRLFSAVLCPQHTSPVQNVLVKSVSPSQAWANRACLSSITDPSRNQLESWRYLVAFNSTDTISWGAKMSGFLHSYYSQNDGQRTISMLKQLISISVSISKVSSFWQSCIVLSSVSFIYT